MRTYASPNPMLRLSHRARFRVAADLVAAERPSRLLDYGAGDGHFLSVIRSEPDAPVQHVAGFEPFRDPQGAVVDRVDDLTPGFDCITCLEVLEHLSDAQQQTFFANVRHLLKPHGTVVVSVPVMIGPSGCFKLLLARAQGRAKGGYTVTNALRSLVGSPPTRRWQNASGWYHHPGFDHRNLRRQLHGVFRTVQEIGCPFPALPLVLNSQVFFLCRGLR